MTLAFSSIKFFSHDSIKSEKSKCTQLLAQPSLCDACKGITFESLWKKEGYQHANLLQLLIRETAASTVNFEVDIPDLATALSMLSTELYTKDWTLERPCPVNLAIHSSRSMGAYDIHVGGKFKRSAGYTPGPEPEFAVGCSLGILNLHEVTEIKAEPLLPRVDENTMFGPFSRWLWGGYHRMSWNEPRVRFLYQPVYWTYRE
jgi:hypothetical protein